MKGLSQLHCQDLPPVYATSHALGRQQQHSFQLHVMGVCVGCSSASSFYAALCLVSKPHAIQKAALGGQVRHPLPG